MQDKPELFFKDRKELRLWLSKNYITAGSFYMVYYKKQTGKECIDYNEALEEALCFGWIDSILKKLDDERYVRQFSRRNPKSTWSERNIKIMKKLIMDGLVKEEIIDEFKKAKKEGRFQKNENRNPEIEMPDIMKNRLALHKKANKQFDTLNKREKQAFFYYITEAKREETKQKRLDDMIIKLEQGWRMPYHRPE
jgi:uncharacterized protein YdeI (YjbR/CyaY-like superfamily)